MVPMPVRLGLVIAACMLSVPSFAGAQQQRASVTGVVLDASSARPLAGVEVFLEGTGFNGLTNAEGRFLLAGVSPGTYRLRAASIGYGTAAKTIEVEAEGTVIADFQLAPSVIALDAVVVTVTGERRKRELGTAIATIDAAGVLDVAPVHKMSDLLQGRSAGVQVLSSTGAPGLGSRIRIRGSGSISLSNEPLIYIDGIRADNAPSLTVWAGGQRPSRFDDLNPEDIESIEIVKGPAAATLYGTDAANGVIRITTKRGRPGPTRWNAWTEVGLVQDRADYPLNYAGLDANSSRYATTCLLADEAARRCSQTGVSSFQVLSNPSLSPITNGRRRQHGLSVTGGSDQVSFYVSAETETETGPYALPGLYRDVLVGRSIPIDGALERPQRFDRVSARANMNAQVGRNTALSVHAGYVSSDLGVLTNDNDNGGLLWSALQGGADPTDRDRAWGFLTPAEIFGRRTTQAVERFTTSATVQSRPAQWLTVRATGGVDYNSRHDVRFSPRDLGVPGEDNLGRRDSNFFNGFRYTLDAVASAGYEPVHGVKLGTSVGVQFFRHVSEGTTTNGTDIVSGTASISAAAKTSGWEQIREEKTVGLFVEQSFDVRDRLFFTAGVRADDNSAFGRDFDLIYYPKLGASWVVSDESFFPETSFLDELRVRAAWGRAGLQPVSGAALVTLESLSVTNANDATVAGVRIKSPGNRRLEPERSTELELGMDADLLGGRLGLEFTYFHKTTDGALVQAPLAPSLGSTERPWVNLGEVLNRGFEGSVRTSVAAGPLRWDVRVSGSTNHNELLTLGEGTDPIGTQFRHVPGFPLGGAWGRPILRYEDADGNGILTANELVIGDTSTFHGPSMPEREVSLSSTLTLFDRLRLYGLLDYRGDFVQWNGTEWARCNAAKCRALSDRTVPLWEQARAVAFLNPRAPTIAGYYEDATFLKLREVSVTWTLTEAWLAPLGVERLTATLAGRNLKTWTRYGGLDPENNFQGLGNFATVDLFTQPPMRYWTLHFNVGF